jgi:hypothetical protein
LDEVHASLRFRHYLIEPYGPHALKTFPRGRQCMVPDCQTVLSVYNPSRCCSAHTEACRPDVEGRPARRKDAELRQCLYCGRPFLSSTPRHKYCSTSCRVRDFQRRSAAARREAA